MEREWCGEKTCEECHCGCLLRVIDNLVPVFDKIRINGILVRVEGKMAGLCIVSCRNGLGVYQYKNAVNRIKGINEYLLRESFERYLQSADTINYTEDMGVENLRYYKEHMAPAHTLLSKTYINRKRLRCMEHKRKKQWILIIMLLLTVCSVFVVYAGREWMFTNPFKPYTFSSVSYASGDGDGCTYVIDDSNRKILKISADGRLLWRACASDKSFLSAERVVADGDGNVYLHDVRIEQGVQIASEGIVKLSSKGKYISTVASVEAEKGSVRRNIVGMVPTEHGVIYMQKEKEGILVSNTEQGSSKVFSVADAQDRILCCAYDRDSDSLFYVTYDGKIYKYTDSGQDELLYDSDTVDGSIPQEISYSDGVLYSADIGLRDIIRIPCDMENTGSTDRLTVEESLKEREIAYHVSAPGTLVSSTNYSVILWDGEDYEQFWDIPLSGKLQVWNCLLWAACAVIVAAVLFFVVTLLKILVKKICQLFMQSITMAVH